jgi:hypothetical protein
VPALISDLVTATEKDPDAERDRDAPARQRLHEIGELVRASAHLWTYRGGALADAAEDLRAHPEFGWLAVRLLALDARFHDDTCVGSMLNIASASTGSPLLAARAAVEVEWALSSVRREIEPACVHHAADRLTARGDLAGGLLAVVLVTCLGQRIGWPAPVRSAVRWLRRHPEADVRAAAWAVFTAAE